MILSDSLFAKSSHSLRTDIDHVLGGGDDGDDLNGDDLIGDDCVDYDSLHTKSNLGHVEDFTKCISVNKEFVEYCSQTIVFIIAIIH